MNWKVKAFVQAAISAMPRNAEINYVFQRYVTRNLPPSAPTLRHTLNTLLSDFAITRQYLSVPLAEARCFEFGAGATLLGPLTFYCLGIENQTLVDLYRLLRPEIVNCAIRFLQEQREPAFHRTPHALIPKGIKEHRLVDWLEHTYGFRYVAPSDARHTPFEVGSFNLVTSKAVFEHVPKPDIEAILAECRRILDAHGVAAFRTDYADHYAYCDARVSYFNFLQYSDAEWRRYSPSLNYMNRLRHRDYLEMFRAAGFDVVADNPYHIMAEDLAILRNLRRAPRFANYTEDELAVRGALTVLKKVNKRRMDLPRQELAGQARYESDRSAANMERSKAI